MDNMNDVVEIGQATGKPHGDSIENLAVLQRLILLSDKNATRREDGP